jgi:hypothetical protein
MRTRNDLEKEMIPTMAMRKRAWISPVLILEDATYATQSKVNNPVEINSMGLNEGLPS